MIENNFKLYKYQEEIIKKQEEISKHAMFMDTGTGKTIVTIDLLIKWLNRYGEDKNILIVAPISVLKQWEEEMCNANNDYFWYRICIVKSDNKSNMYRFEKRPITIVNYEKLVSKKFLGIILSKTYDAVILDESMRIKNPQAKVTKNVIKYLSYPRKKFILSGTPNPNGLQDLWSQYSFLNGVLGKSFYSFRNQFFEDKNLKKKHFMARYWPDWQVRPGAQEKILAKINSCTSVARKQDCLDLPPLVNIHRYTELSAEQKKHYKNLHKEFISYISDTEACVAKTAMTKLIRLAQVVMGFIVDEEGKITKLDNNRIKTLQEVLESINTDKQIIIWTNYRETYKDISALLDNLGETYSMMIGGLKDNEREQVLDEFRSGKSRILVANPASGGVGLNLQCASYMIYYQNSFNFTNDAQSEARCYRSGSEIHDKITRIDILCEGTIDLEIKKALGQKKEVLDYILEGVK